MRVQWIWDGDFNLNKEKMDWQLAIQKSDKKSAKRIELLPNGKKKTIIRYDDGSGFIVISKNGRTEFEHCREAMSNELEGYLDWQPSE